MSFSRSLSRRATLLGCVVFLALVAGVGCEEEKDKIEPLGPPSQVDDDPIEELAIGEFEEAANDTLIVEGQTPPTHWTADDKPPHAINWRKHFGKDNLVVMFAPSARDEHYQEMHQRLEGTYKDGQVLIDTKMDEVRERLDIVHYDLFENGKSRVGPVHDMVRVIEEPGDEVLSEGAAAAARDSLKVEAGDYTMVVIGKDGHEKLRTHEPMNAADLLSFVYDLNEDFKEHPAAKKSGKPEVHKPELFKKLDKEAKEKKKRDES